jgi:hypothetical protein
MSVESHINQLELRHRSLEAELTEMSAAPGIDQTEIVTLKRQKLWLKDEIHRLRKDALVH